MTARAKPENTEGGPAELSDLELESVTGALNKSELVEFINRNGNLSDLKAGAERSRNAAMDTARKGLTHSVLATTSERRAGSPALAHTDE